MKIIKRNGSEQTFSKNNIIKAVSNANQTVKLDMRLSNDEIKNIAKSIEEKCRTYNTTLNVDDIQYMVQDELIKTGKTDLVIGYITFKSKRDLDRRADSVDEKILAILNSSNETIKQENSNKNPDIVYVERDYIAGEKIKDIGRKYLIAPDIIKAHDEGLIHFHDMDYFADNMINCCLINLEDMLQNGTVINKNKIEKPHRFSNAMTIASQIAAKVASEQYGGQTMNISHLVPFVEETRKSLRERNKDLLNHMSKEQFDEHIEKMTRLDIIDGVQCFMYQISTITGTNGQAPFISLFIYINEVPEAMRNDYVMVVEEIFNQRILGMKNEFGIYVPPAFPKILYVLDENNVYEGSEFFELTKKAAICTSQRMVPDYISAKKMRELKDGNVFGCMGCRSFLGPYYEDKNGNPTTKKKGKPKFWGRTNMGVVTINLPDVALCSGRDEEKFWLLLDQRLELCHRALQARFDHARKIKTDNAPELWQYGALARLPKGQTIEKMLLNDRTSISLGYVGLYETVKYMTGKDHWIEDDNGGAKSFGLSIMKFMNDKCNMWKQYEHIGYSIYGTPEESTTAKFADALRRRHGLVPGITDKNFVTNSYHVPVWIEIPAKEKLSAESPFSDLSTGGAISYIEAPDMRNNVDAIIEILQHIYENIMYAELNLKLDHCNACGYDGAFPIERIDSKFQFKCPQCGETEFAHTPTLLRSCRRTCGYIGTEQYNQGRMGEISKRVEHTDKKSELWKPLNYSD